MLNYLNSLLGTDRQTDRQTDRPTDIGTYRAAIAAKNANKIQILNSYPTESFITFHFILRKFL